MAAPANPQPVRLTCQDPAYRADGLTDVGRSIAREKCAWTPAEYAWLQNIGDFGLVGVAVTMWHSNHFSRANDSVAAHDTTPIPSCCAPKAMTSTRWFDTALDSPRTSWATLDPNLYCKEMMNQHVLLRPSMPQLRKAIWFCLAAISTLALSASIRSPLYAADSTRVTRGLQVLYDFREPSGPVIEDRSGNRDPIHLQIKNTKHVHRTEGAIRITGNNIIRSKRPAKRLSAAVTKSGSITIEAWIRPIGLNQKGPARIVTLSESANRRNFTLGQEGDAIEVRLRTTKTNENGIPALRTPAGSIKERLTHVVYTRSRDGVARLYLNGKQKAQKRIPGSTGNWDERFELALADEITGQRGWRGHYNLVAIYDRALSPVEVNQNFSAGPHGRGSKPKFDRQQLLARRFESHIAPILSNHCMECHDSASKAGKLDLSRKAAALAGGESGPAIVAGKPDQSLFWELVQSDDMPRDRSPLSREEKETLRKWIADGAVWSVDFVDPAIYRNTRRDDQWVQRLTIPEYVATVKTVFGVNIQQQAESWLPKDKRADGFRNTAYNLTVDLKHVEGYAKLAAEIVSQLDVIAFARRFSKSQKLTDDNMRSLIADMGKWVLRGPLEEHEVVLYRGITTSVASAGGDFREAVAMVLEAMLQSPRFLYRVEHQIGDGSLYPVGDYELASRISYILWGSAPDESLFKAAESGDLSDPKEFERQIDRMMKDPRAIERSKQFITEWLNLDRLDHMAPNRKRFPNWNESLARDMRRETIEFFVDLVWKQRRPLTDLISAQYTFATPQLARHYGLTPQGEGFRRYDLSKIPSRGGLLTQGSVLTIGGDDASMVTRGLFVLNDLLFSEVGDPPPGLDTTPVPTSPGRTHRAIALERIRSEACGGCHSRFEPLAFGLEKYDGLGSFHEIDEHGNQLQEDGDILFPGEETPVRYETSAEMMQLLAGSPRVNECLTRKVTQFALGRPLYASDAPEMRKIVTQARAQGGTYQAVIRTLLASDLVQLTRTQPDPVVASASQTSHRPNDPKPRDSARNR